MKVIPFEQASRPASTAAPQKDAPKPDVDPAHQHAVPPFSDEGHPHEEPGYGHGV